MTKKNQIYKCPICENIIKVVHEASGTLVCCDKPMLHMAENTEDAAIEKHVPVVERTETGGLLIRVGAVDHPMEADHYIEWIEVTANSKTCRKNLKPGDNPEARFCTKSDTFSVRAYCNLHGLWKNNK